MHGCLNYPVPCWVMVAKARGAQECELEPSNANRCKNFGARGFAWPSRAACLCGAYGLNCTAFEGKALTLPPNPACAEGCLDPLEGVPMLY